ncbi:MAG: TIGR00730 family Rossman fold protein [Oligoflexia bacterium]|nr:TIGR00730 family Rossman fold protein [Oligoflexia bacterium]
MKAVCVFCGSRTGASSVFLETAQELGKLIAKKNLKLVYGGAQVGLMGAVADSCLEAGGQAIGVVPQVILENEVEHKHLTEIHHVGTMHERKALMVEKSDAFIAIPGGFGTLDELFEILTWGQLKIHHKPIYLINVTGFFDHLIDFVDFATKQGLIHPDHRKLLNVLGSVSDLESLL